MKKLFAFLAIFSTLSVYAAKYHTGLIAPGGWQLNAEFLDDKQFLPLPESFDWREKLGKQIEIRNQGQCGSCWAQARVEAIEWAQLIAGKEVKLSTQELTSCDNNFYGCGGGFFSDYEVVLGLSLESEFPYRAQNLRCPRVLPHGNKISRWLFIGSQNRSPSVDEVKQAILLYGPIAVTVSANTSFMNYRSGVYGANGCNQGQTNHMVVLTGWTKHNAWNLQNSWGESWGNHGFMEIAFGCNNVAETAAVALLQE